MRQVRAKFDKRVRIEPVIRSSELYWVSGGVYRVRPLQFHENEEIIFAVIMHRLSACSA